MKYHNQKITVRGRTFDSKKEAERFLLLEQLMKNGEIQGLKCQVPFILCEKQYRNGKLKEREWKYIADFVYYRNGEKVVEDVKGYRNKSDPAYRLFVHCRKMMLKVHDIEVIEI